MRLFKKFVDLKTSNQQVKKCPFHDVKDVNNMCKSNYVTAMGMILNNYLYSMEVIFFIFNFCFIINYYDLHI